ncbi:hypothetical protein [Thalassotalea aquiviva]|uniref:hypothetical protein n=1 Tax=Thalassotalea aquiviva TaxID=3242415 RepID=UPI00352A6E44
MDGSTSLLLAAELNEIDLFERMVESGGNPLLTVPHPEEGFPVDCYFIAYANKSKQVLEYLEQNKNNMFHKFGKPCWNWGLSQQI